MQARRNLILLTPDDSHSNYIQKYLDIDPCIRHLGWRRVYELLPPVEEGKCSVFWELVDQFRNHIQKTIFKQDIVGGILKISFGDKSEIYEGKYLEEIRTGKWTGWNTPRAYKSLDGKGRRLLLYDRHRGVTIEFEIGKIENSEEQDYPYKNAITGSPKFFNPPIPLEHIRTLESFQDFGKHGKDRNAFRNLTQEQYRLLVSSKWRMK